jgi:multidrug efflux system outer membrane protein
MKYIIFSALILVLSACSLTPDLVRPAAPIPDTYSTQQQMRGKSIAETGWRRVFTDAQLQYLIQLALKNNRDLRVASLNVETVRAQFQIQNSARLPTIDATAGSIRQRTAMTDSAAASVNTQHTAGLAITAFELDFFGRVKSLSNAAFARYLASEQGQRSAKISLIGAVADAYYENLLARQQLDLTEKTLADWRTSLKLTRSLKTAGQVSIADVTVAEGQVASAEADLSERQRQLSKTHNALRLLTGSDFVLNKALTDSFSDHALPPQIPAGLPSDLLTLRPDILQAEQNLVAANADIGSARAAFFPRISLTTSVGYSSSSLSNLFGGNQHAWSFAPQMTQPIFQHGRLRSELKLAEIRKSSAVADYERAIQTAFREVADALAGQATYASQIEAQQRFSDSARKNLELTRIRYHAGQDSRLQLLDAQRTLYTAQRSLLELRKQEYSNTVALYKSLGGGVLDE